MRFQILIPLCLALSSLRLAGADPETVFKQPPEAAHTPATQTDAKSKRVWLDLGTVHDLAQVRLNGRDPGVGWTTPWRLEITDGLTARRNKLKILATHTWANRLTGDEQGPADASWGKAHFGFGGPLKADPKWFLPKKTRPSPGRDTFTTWNYFNPQPPLLPAGI